MAVRPEPPFPFSRTRLASLYTFGLGPSDHRWRVTRRGLAPTAPREASGEAVTIGQGTLSASGCAIR
jgi:hypothetical protein